jgi:hypothetical protein
MTARAATRSAGFYVGHKFQFIDPQKKPPPDWAAAVYSLSY